MDKVIFFVKQGDPLTSSSLWATGNVSGAYSSAPEIGTSIHLTGGGFDAGVTFKRFDTDNKKWLATISGSSETGATTNLRNLYMQGAGAGKIIPAGTGGTIAGTAAGVSWKITPQPAVTSAVKAGGVVRK